MLKREAQHQTATTTKLERQTQRDTQAESSSPDRLGAANDHQFLLQRANLLHDLLGIEVALLGALEIEALWWRQASTKQVRMESKARASTQHRPAGDIERKQAQARRNGRDARRMGKQLSGARHITQLHSKDLLRVPDQALEVHGQVHVVVRGGHDFAAQLWKEQRPGQGAGESCGRWKEEWANRCCAEHAESEKKGGMQAFSRKGGEQEKPQNEHEMKGFVPCRDRRPAA